MFCIDEYSLWESILPDYEDPPQLIELEDSIEKQFVAHSFVTTANSNAAGQMINRANYYVAPGLPAGGRFEVVKVQRILNRKLRDAFVQELTEVHQKYKSKPLW